MNHKSFYSCDPNTHQSENTWFTPKIFKDELGEFDLDVCTVSYRPFDFAKNHFEHDLGTDSLKENWFGYVWMNPPYGKEIAPFIDKFIKHSNGVALVFARMGTPWIQHFMLVGDAIFFLRKRVRFITKNLTQKHNAGADSCLLLMGETAISKIQKCKIQGVLVKLK